VSTAGPDDSEDFRNICTHLLDRHSAALSWQTEIGFPISIIWLPRSVEVYEGYVHSSKGDVSGWTNWHVEAIFPNSSLRRKAESASMDKIALVSAMNSLIPQISATQKPGLENEDENELTYDRQIPNPQSCFLYHTSLGGPKIGWQGDLANWAREIGVLRRNLHISFTHDGDAHICAAAWAPGLKGLGMDAVYLPRLNDTKKDRSYFLKLASKFMSDEEYEFFHGASENETEQQLAVRVAAHFSLMESTSKALGTGLKIGGGMGRATSLKKQSLNVMNLNPVEFSLAPEAEARIGTLRASRLEGYWAADNEYLVSLAVLC
jgi:phosphopantetheinyl transferase (holo-ACP synthase)